MTMLVCWWEGIVGALWLTRTAQPHPTSSTRSPLFSDRPAIYVLHYFVTTSGPFLLLLLSQLSFPLPSPLLLLLVLTFTPPLLPPPQPCHCTLPCLFSHRTHPALANSTLSGYPNPLGCPRGRYLPLGIPHLISQVSNFFCHPHRKATLSAQFRFLPALAHARALLLNQWRKASMRWEAEMM